MKTKRKLPLGIQTFRKIREQGCYYVDKTAYARRLVEEGDHYFLSRPRRFGKSLFLDTLKELFEGNEPLFRGLAVHDGWDWSVRRPVVRLDFGSGSYRRADDLHREVMEQIDAIEEAAGEESEYDTAPSRLRHLLRALHRRAGQRVAVLVDEYFEGVEALVRGLFAAIPFEWHTRNEIARYEGYYASVFYAWLAAVGLDVTVEDSGAAWRADLAVRLDGNVYLFEFKVVEQAPGGAALAQLRAKGYADKYRHRAREVHLIGVEFSRQERNVVAFETERA